MNRRIAARGRNALIAAGWSLLQSACGTIGPRPLLTSDIAVPAVWPQAPDSLRPLDTAALAAWWMRFNDPVLEELIAGALRSSPDVQSALSRIAEFRARRGVERAGFFPSFDGNITGGRTRTTNRDTDVTTTHQSFAASVDASWQVDLFGRQRQTLAAASADLAQREENYHGAQASLAADVASAYVTLRSAEAQLAVVQRSVGSRSETLQLSRWREQAGTGSALATQQSTAALELARSSIPTLQLIVAQTRNQLALLAGRPPGALDPLLAPPQAVPAAPPDLAIGIPAEMLRQRPDVRAAERGLEAAFARTVAARRQRIPSLSLGGSIGVEALTAGRLFNPASTMLNLLGGFSAPIFDAGRIRQTIAIQRELEQQSLNTYAATVLGALGEVEDALVAVRRHTERLDILSRAAAAAREAETLSTLQYQAGQVDLLVILDAQRTLLDLEQQTVASAANRAIAYVQLYQALGGGWTVL